LILMSWLLKFSPGILIFVCIILISGCIDTQISDNISVSGNVSESGQTLFVYSGAGLKEPMMEIASVFEEKTGIAVTYTFGGSGTLISQMELSKSGDAFIPGGMPDYDAAMKKGLVGEPQYVAYHVPVIAVSKGNPNQIGSVEDLAQPGLKVILGDPASCAIGKKSDQILKEHGILQEVEENVVSRSPTINELVVAMNLGTVDATIITIDQVNPETMDVIHLPSADNVVLIIPVGITTFTTKADLAGQFTDFVASDEGKTIFKNHGFPTYPDPFYEEVTA
jgi:molybdate transport system substrate-binding protein